MWRRRRRRSSPTMAAMFDPSPGFHLAGLPEREQVS